jgi:hypothetical protein
MTLVRVSLCLMIVAIAMVFGISATASASNLPLRTTRHAGAKQCHVAKHRKDMRAKSEHCLSSRHHKAGMKPSSGEKHCPLCKGGCPAFEHPAGGLGPTALVGGIEVVGGPGRNPEACAHWEAGEVRVADVSGKIVATQKITRGHTYDIPVSPGTYTLTAVFGPGSLPCKSGPFTAIAGKKTEAVVLCNIK